MTTERGFDDVAAVARAVRGAVSETTITDIHTHLFPPAHGKLLLWGADELLTYHYLVAELFTVAPRQLSTEAFWKLPKAEQADLVWEHVFIRHGAMSEAARGVITTFNALGLDVAGRDYLAKVFEIANISCAVMTNDPFQPAEVEHWRGGAGETIGKIREKGLRPALRIDSLILNWPAAAKMIQGAGYRTTIVQDDHTYAEARRFLTDWAATLGGPTYLAASLPPEFGYPADTPAARTVRNVVLPVARELGIPFAMMIGVRKRVNPALGDGGDAVGVADVDAVAQLCAQNPDVKFLVTMLSRVNQHELCVCARKFGNLHLFGCWWFCNDPSMIDEITRMRLELLGANFTCNHSDARVLDQLIYKWSHTRRVVADVLVDKYADQFRAGWRATEKEIRRDVHALFGGAFEEFLAK